MMLARAAFLVSMSVLPTWACGGSGPGEGGDELPAGFELRATRTDGGADSIDCPSSATWRVWFENVSADGATLTPNGADGPGGWMCSAPMRSGESWVIGCEAGTSVSVSSAFVLSDGGGTIDFVGTWVANGDPACSTAYRVDSLVEDLDGP